MIKICFIVDHYQYYGGVQQVIRCILHYLDRSQFIISLVVLKDDIGLDYPDDVEVYALRLRKIRYAIPKLVSIIRKIQPDLIVPSYEQTNIVTIITHLISRIPAKIIAWQHTHLSSQLRYTVKSSCNQYIMKLILNILYKKCAKILVVSEEAKNDLLKITTLDKTKLKVILNPIDSERLKNLMFEPINEEWLKSERKIPVLLAVGRLVSGKQFDHLIKAVAILRKKIRLRLIIIGSGNENPALRKLQGELGLDGVIKFISAQTNTIKYMSRVDALVFPSLWEGLPIVLIEAMYAGLPIVAYDCPSGPSEIIDHGINGILVKPNNINDLAEAIEKVLTNRELKLSLAKAGKDKAIEFYITEKIQEYESFFVDVCNSRI